MAPSGKSFNRWLLLLFLAPAAFGAGSETRQPRETRQPEKTGPGDLHYVRDASFPRTSFAFTSVSWIAIDAQGKLLYVLERIHPAVVVLRLDGSLVTAWPTQALGKPHAIELHELHGQRSIWITDMAPPRTAGRGFGHCIKHFTTSGQELGTLGKCGPDSQGTGIDPVQFDLVTDLSWSSGDRRFVTDGDQGGLNHRVLAIDPRGKVEQVWSAPNDQPGSGPKEFNLPHADVVDRCDRVWIVDTLNHQIQAVSAAGEYLGKAEKFGGDRLYGLALGRTTVRSGVPRAHLFVTASPEQGGRGTVHVFEVPMDCRRIHDLGSLSPVARWEVPLASGAALHAIAVDPVSEDLYLSPLGTNPIPPQKWIVSR